MQFGIFFYISYNKDNFNNWLTDMWGLQNKRKQVNTTILNSAALFIHDGQAYRLLNAIISYYLHLKNSYMMECTLKFLTKQLSKICFRQQNYYKILALLVNWMLIVYFLLLFVATWFQGFKINKFPKITAFCAHFKYLFNYIYWSFCSKCWVFRNRNNV